MAANTMEMTSVLTNLEELIVDLYPEYWLEANGGKARSANSGRGGLRL
jgi:hypothetical protein